MGLSYRTWSRTKQLWQQSEPLAFAFAQGTAGGAERINPRRQDGRANIWDAVLAVRRPVVIHVNDWPGPEVLLSLLLKEPAIIALQRLNSS